MPEKTDNRSVGGRFEQRLSHRLAEAGFWVHVMQQNAAGQPADLIAVKGKYCVLIDCKVISDGNGFPFRRMEENQRLAMQKFARITKGDNCWFALEVRGGDADGGAGGGVYMLNFVKAMMMENAGLKSIGMDEMDVRCWGLDTWLKATDVWAEDLW